MDKSKRAQLEGKGWEAGAVTELFELTPEESALMEIKRALSHNLRQRRRQRMTQAALAARIHSSQPRIAQAEGGANSVSIELLLRAMLATGATPQDIAQTIAAIPMTRALF